MNIWLCAGTLNLQDRRLSLYKSTSFQNDLYQFLRRLHGSIVIWHLILYTYRWQGRYRVHKTHGHFGRFIYHVSCYSHVIFCHLLANHKVYMYIEGWHATRILLVQSFEGLPSLRIAWYDARNWCKWNEGNKFPTNVITGSINSMHNCRMVNLYESFVYCFICWSRCWTGPLWYYNHLWFQIN